MIASSLMPLIVGPCVIEDEGFVLEVAQELMKQLKGKEVDFYFKSSFDKANRSSIKGFRGPGLKKGLEILSKVKQKTGAKILTDFHSVAEAEAVAEVVDWIQVPAFLCRQTDMIAAAAEVALKRRIRLNVKKGQFLAPWDTLNIVEKVKSVSESLLDQLTLTERGTSFGYNNLVVDMSAFQTMKKFGVKVIFDATHSVQMPGAAAGGTATGGKRENIEVLARAAMAAGADGVFAECHPNPKMAKSDGPNALPLETVSKFVDQCLQVRKLVATMPKILEQ